VYNYNQADFLLTAGNYQEEKIQLVLPCSGDGHRKNVWKQNSRDLETDSWCMWSTGCLTVKGKQKRMKRTGWHQDL